MSKFYSILLDDKLHECLKRVSFEKGEKMSVLVRQGIESVLFEKNEFSEGKGKNSNGKA